MGLESIDWQSPLRLELPRTRRMADFDVLGPEIKVKKRNVLIFHTFERFILAISSEANRKGIALCCPFKELFISCLSTTAYILNREHRQNYQPSLLVLLIMEMVKIKLH